MRKAFQVQVEIQVQAVSCPGVWLCPNGKVSLQLYMLGSCIQTTSVNPVFPLIYQEKFVFYKTYYSVQKLNDLQKMLCKEVLYAELIQWQNCEVGNVLAIFQTSLSELLFPENRRGTIAGADIDLLMEPMNNFPGILAPKIEVGTNTVIRDKICREEETCQSYVVSPQVLSSKANEVPAAVVRQRKVCHSSKYHRSKKCSNPCQDVPKPPFVCRKVNDNLINRKREDICGTGNDCQCRRSPRRNLDSIPKDIRSKSIGPPSQKSVHCVKRDRRCSDCTGRHNEDQCAVCSRYNHYFDAKAPSIQSKRVSPRRWGPREEIDNERCCAENSVLCNYPPTSKKPSLAEKIHSRLTETFNQCGISESPTFENCSNNIPPCERRSCSSLEDNCTVSSFGQLYKDFYRKSRAKCEKYIASN